MESDDTGSATYLDESTSLMEEWARATDPLTVPIHRLYPVVDSWLQAWPLPFQARLSAGESPTSGYQLSVELSREEGDHLLGRLMEAVAEEEGEEMPRLEDHRNSEE